MIERGEQSRFALESRHAIGVGRERRRQDLHRDVAIELRVARAIDLSHPAGAERGENFVGAEACAGGNAPSGAEVAAHCSGSRLPALPRSPVDGRHAQLAELHRIADDLDRGDFPVRDGEAERPHRRCLGATTSPTAPFTSTGQCELREVAVGDRSFRPHRRTVDLRWRAGPDRLVRANHEIPIRGRQETLEVATT